MLELLKICLSFSLLSIMVSMHYLTAVYDGIYPSEIGIHITQINEA